MERFLIYITPGDDQAAEWKQDKANVEKPIPVTFHSTQNVAHGVVLVTSGTISLRITPENRPRYDAFIRAHKAEIFTWKVLRGDASVDSNVDYPCHGVH